MNYIKVENRKTKINVISKTSDGKSEGSSQISILRKRTVPDKFKERFYNEIHVLYTSGIDLKTCFEIIIQSESKSSVKKVIEDVLEGVIKGGSVSKCMLETGRFSQYECYSMMIGEESGKLGDVFYELSRYYTDKIKLRRQLISAMTYPSIILLTAITSFIFMLNFVVPMFADVFKRFNAKLPEITQKVISISDWFSNNLIWIILGFISFIAFTYWARDFKLYKKIKSSLVLRIPILGGIIKKIYLARFCQAMYLLNVSKVNLVSSIELVKKMISFYPIEECLDEVSDEISQGKPLYMALSKFNFFESRFISLVKIGEEVNELDKIFIKLKSSYSEEAEYETKMLSSFIEPLIIIFVGIFVGVILVSMYLPMFKLGTNF